MEGIEHRTVTVNGVNLHVAEKGQGPNIVLLLHGFPDLWYTWRHQITALAAAGYRAVAPDLRGYGGSDAPAEASAYTCHHLIGDLVALIDSLGEAKKVYVVAHDWGAWLAWYLCMFRPDKVKAYVCLAVQFQPRNPKMKPLAALRAFFGDDYYICRFQEPDMESELKSIPTRTILKAILTGRNPGPPKLPKGHRFSCPEQLPAWLSEEDLDYYTSQFERTGFIGGLNYYRAIDSNWELTAAWTGAQVTVPAKFIVGDLDMTYTTPGVKEYIHGGEFKRDVPLMEDVVVMENVGHFLNQERPEEVNAMIIDFLKKF